MDLVIILAIVIGVIAVFLYGPATLKDVGKSLDRANETGQYEDHTPL